jgi:hypothetical protein
LFVLSPKAHSIIGNLYEAIELIFEGSDYTYKDNPVGDIYFVTIWRNGIKMIQVYGFNDGDGSGGKEGNIFKVRFCPSMSGERKLEEVLSNDPLNNPESSYNPDRDN